METTKLETEDQNSTSKIDNESSHEVNMEGEPSKTENSKTSNGENKTSSKNVSELSKRAIKKQLKRQEWIDTKAERKALQKEKRKAKIERGRAEGKFDVTYSQRRKRLKQLSKMTESDCKINVVLDLSFDDLMSDKDMGKCLKQLLRCYSINRRLPSPLQFHISGVSGRSEAELDNRHSGYLNWDCHVHKESFMETFTSAPYNKSKKDIVYLTSDSENVIGEKLDQDKVYIIGGLVDHNAHKGVCHKLAKENGISHARLPIDEYIEIKTRKVLTIDHVFQILAQVGSQGQSWKSAFMSIIPERKGAKELDSDDDNQEEDLQTEVVDEKSDEAPSDIKDEIKEV